MWVLTFIGGIITGAGLIAGDLGGVALGLVFASPGYISDIKPSLRAIRKDIRTLLHKR